MGGLPTPADVVRETRHGLVVKLRLEGETYRTISERIGLSISQCQRVYEAALARRRGDLDIEEHRDQVFVDLEMLLEVLRPYVHGGPPHPEAIHPSKEHVDGFLKVIDRKVRLLGLNAPKETHVQQEVILTKDNGESQEFLGRVADWWAETQRRRAAAPRGRLDAIDVPAFPSSTTNGSKANGHVSWQQVLDNPALDED